MMKFTNFKQKMIGLTMAGSLLLASVQPSVAAIEIDETDFGPSYGTMVADTVVGKPLQLVNAVAGTALFVVSLPFSIAGGNTDEARRTLVEQPWQAMSRCLGCTVAEDEYYKLQDSDKNVVRIVVDQPSEILINTNDTVEISQ